MWLTQSVCSQTGLLDPGPSFFLPLFIGIVEG